MTQTQMNAQLEFALLKNSSLSSDEQHQLVVFLLIFNVFEARLFKDGRGVSKLLRNICNDIANEPWFRIGDFQDYADFLKKRYVANGTMTVNFSRLKLSGSASDVSTDRGNAKAVLLGKELSTDKVLLCYFCIAYRFRNNLFHGNKDVLGLNAYYDCFSEIVTFMVSIMDKMIANNFSGLQTKY